MKSKYNIDQYNEYYILNDQLKYFLDTAYFNAKVSSQKNEIINIFEYFPLSDKKFNKLTEFVNIDEEWLNIMKKYSLNNYSIKILKKISERITYILKDMEVTLSSTNIEKQKLKEILINKCKLLNLDINSEELDNYLNDCIISNIEYLSDKKKCDIQQILGKIASKKSIKNLNNNATANKIINDNSNISNIINDTANNTNLNNLLSNNLSSNNIGVHINNENNNNILLEKNNFNINNEIEKKNPLPPRWPAKTQKNKKCKLCIEEGKNHYCYIHRMKCKYLFNKNSNILNWPAKTIKNMGCKLCKKIGNNNFCSIHRRKCKSIFYTNT